MKEQNKSEPRPAHVYAKAGMKSSAKKDKGTMESLKVLAGSISCGVTNFVTHAVRNPAASFQKSWNNTGRKIPQQSDSHTVGGEEIAY